MNRFNSQSGTLTNMDLTSPRLPADYTCCVCFSAYDTTSRRPWDLGCGHCVCEPCYNRARRENRSCPECRTAFNNPHPQFTLLRILETRQKIWSHPIIELEEAASPSNKTNTRRSRATPAAGSRCEISPVPMIGPSFDGRASPSAPPVLLLTARGSASNPSCYSEEPTSLLTLPPHHFWHQPRPANARTSDGDVRPCTDQRPGGLERKWGSRYYGYGSSAGSDSNGEGWGTEWDEDSDSGLAPLEVNETSGWVQLLLGHQQRVGAGARPHPQTYPSDIVAVASGRCGEAIGDTLRQVRARLAADWAVSVRQLRSGLACALPINLVPSVRAVNYWSTSLLVGLAAYHWHAAACLAPLLLTVVAATLAVHLPVQRGGRLLAPLKVAVALLAVQGLAVVLPGWLLPRRLLLAVAGWSGRLLLLTAAVQAAVELWEHHEGGVAGVRGRLCAAKAIAVLSALLLGGQSVALWTACWLQKAYLVHQLCTVAVTAWQVCQRRQRRQLFQNLQKHAGGQRDSCGGTAGMEQPMLALRGSSDQGLVPQQLMRLPALLPSAPTAMPVHEFERPSTQHQLLPQPHSSCGAGLHCLPGNSDMHLTQAAASPPAPTESSQSCVIGSSAAGSAARPELTATAAAAANAEAVISPLCCHVMLSVVLGVLLYCFPNAVVGGRWVPGWAGQLLAWAFRVVASSAVLSAAWGCRTAQPGVQTFLLLLLHPPSRAVGGGGGMVCLAQLAVPVLLPVLLANTLCLRWPSLLQPVASFAQLALLLSIASELVRIVAADAWQLGGSRAVRWWLRNRLADHDGHVGSESNWHGRQPKTGKGV